jgi:hypothetical protein
VRAARAVPERTLEIRYEQLVSNPDPVANRVSDYLELDPEPLRASLSKAFDRSVGRYRKDLTPTQLEEVEAEAGELLSELGYLD